MSACLRVQNVLLKQITYSVDPAGPSDKIPSAKREALRMFCYDFQVGTSTNMEKQPWRPSAANRPEPDSRLRAQRKHRKLSSIILLLLLVPFVAYEFNRMWQDPKLQPAHFTLAVAVGALILLGILLLAGLLLRRPAKHADSKSILRL